jgi:hypothetical protein
MWAWAQAGKLARTGSLVSIKKKISTGLLQQQVYI